MAVWASVKMSALGRGLRLDAEYYQPYLLRYERMLAKAPFPVKPLGELVRDGYRVVYENTEIIEGEAGDPPPDCVRFLQAADINSGFPNISTDGMGWVSRADWDRYTKGRIIPGELLIEVKGLARKVAIVPDDFPPETLVTGSVFKLQTRAEQLDPYFLLTYLLSSFGVGFRFRCLTNTLIGFVNKDELYDISTPVPPLAVQRAVATLAHKSIAKWRTASLSMAAAEAQLMAALGLDRLDISPQKCYTRHFRELQGEARFDAEYFNPKYQRIIKKLRNGGRTLADVAPLSDRPFDPSLRPKGSTFRYIEIGSLTGDGEAEAETLDVAEAPSRATWIVKPGDVITSTVRPIRRLSALVRDDQEGCVCSSGFAALTPRPGPDGIEPEVLLTYLRLPIICEILDLHTTASMYPAIPVDRLMRIPILVPDTTARKAVAAKVQEAMTARRSAAQLLEQAKVMVEDLIGDGSGGPPPAWTNTSRR